jgi:ubiquinone/menaquinone biosynthesis C-methylase UbiE
MSPARPQASLQHACHLLEEVKRELDASVTIELRVEEDHYEAPSPWRLMGAVDKARNVVALCSRNHIAPRRVLEVGAGDGAILKRLDEMSFCGEVHALEVSGSGVQVIRGLGIPSVAQVSRFDGYRIPYDDDTFDLVILSHVLEHVEHERVLLREIQRVSRFQVIEIPLDFSQEVDRLWAHLTSYGHINVYQPPALRFLLKTERFRILDDLARTESLEVMEYLHFVHQRHVRTSESVAQVRSDIARRQTAFEALPVHDKEKAANTYSVLTRRITDAELVEEHLALARSYYAKGRPGDAKLILKGIARCTLATRPQLPQWAEAVLNDTAES